LNDVPTSSPGDSSAASEFANHCARRRRAIARDAFRVIVADYIGKDPGDVTLCRDTRGKPYVRNKDGSNRCLYVSSSRSGSRALFAVAQHRPIGVDLEDPKPDRFADKVAEFMLSEQEAVWYSTVSSERRARWLANVWVRKEALLKGVGCGLQIDPCSFSVMASPDCVHDEPLYRSSTFPSWQVFDLQWANSVIALAVHNDASSSFDWQSARERSMDESGFVLGKTFSDYRFS
jgi:phosphopantetheinyl transferase